MTPPTFEHAKNHRQRVRAAGLSPDYWYPVEWERNVKRGKAIDVRFWDESIAVYRGLDGTLRAIENRCAHRQLKLSLGVVGDCTLTCAYHGWTYEGDGRCVRMAHDLFGHKFPRIKVRSYPLQVKHGLIWLFPGNPALAETRPVPEIPELEGRRPWGSIAIDFLWRAHHSMIIDNVSDFTHAYLHRRSKPFTDAKLTKMETSDDRVLLAYDTKVGQGRISGLFVDRKRTNTNAMTLAYEYPYQWSNTDDKIKHWCFVLPIDGQTTRVFFIFYFSDQMLRVPLVPLPIPRPLVRVIMAASKRLLVAPLLSEDGFAVEAEQQAWTKHYDQPIAELNPVVHQFQQLTIRKWEEHLSQSGRTPAAISAQALSG
jgi:phenylpropionate dioxygenase-like ring-hydroxylating dioxygenase large terminal subunit